MSLRKKLETESCASFPSAKVSLLSEGESQKITVVEKAHLKPNTDYVLELSHPDINCRGHVKLSYDIVAWADEANEETKPNFAFACEDSKISVPVFFPTQSIVPGYHTEAKKLFLSPYNYCGQTVLTSAELSCVQSKTVSECSAKTSVAEYSFRMETYLDQGRLKLTCRENNRVYFQDEFTQCRKLILDFSSYKND